RPTTYWDYIKTEQILALQGGLEEDDAGLSNDEVVFIVVHQIDELWFKLALRELQEVRDLFASGKVPEQTLSSVVRGIRRAVLLFDQIASHFVLMETLTTRDYLGFRDKLSPASGFQSAQMRELEILMGLRPEERIPLGHEKDYMEALRYPDGEESAAFHRVARRLADTPSLKQALDDWLFRTPIQGSRPDDAGDDAV
ncbi:MAG: tryptophan 2,3-dioxygenase, partial [Myxococcales bacterium]|nr:tryptophan 2,3-dioxygenase [Myxococcales bacterium]